MRMISLSRDHLFVFHQIIRPFYICMERPLFDQDTDFRAGIGFDATGAEGE